MGYKNFLIYILMRHLPPVNRADFSQQTGSAFCIRTEFLADCGPLADL
jgi:hypothetical protein